MSTSLPVHPTLTHPLTGVPLVAIGLRRNGTPIWPIMGGSEDAGAEGGGGDGGGGDGSGAGDGGGDGQQQPAFPADTRPEDMETDAQRAAYYQHQARRHENRNKEWLSVFEGKRPEEVRDSLKSLKALEEASKTEQERAVDEARKAGRVEAQSEFGTRLAAAEFRGALSHLPADQRDQIIEGINLASYINSDGDVDTDKVTSFVKLIASPGKGEGAQDLGGGRRGAGTGGAGKPAGGSIAAIREERAKARAERAAS